MKFTTSDALRHCLITGLKLCMHEKAYILFDSLVYFLDPPPLPLVPPVSLSARTSLDGGVVMESAYNLDNPYDEIPGGGANRTHLLQQQHHQQPSNLYAEINPRPDPRLARGSAERGTPSNSRTHCKFKVFRPFTYPLSQHLRPQEFIFCLDK